MLNFCSLTPKTHTLARNHVVWRIVREIRFRGLYYADLLPRRGPHFASHSVRLSVCLSVRLSVRPSRYRTEGRISYGHLGRTDSCWLWSVVRTRNKKKPSNLWCENLCIRGKETPWGIVTTSCVWVDIRDIITCATFSDDRLWGLGVARGQISVSPLTCRRRPQNTLALPRECVICSALYWVSF